MMTMVMVLVIVGFSVDDISAATLEKKENTITVPDEWITKSKSDVNSMVYPLANEPIALGGLIDRAEVYYEVPIGELTKETSLHLAVEYSQLLLSGSTVTVKVDDEPVYSKKLSTKKTTMDMDVPIKGDAIKLGFHRISIEFYGHIADDFCVNEENPANWFTILESSHLKFDFESVEKRNDMLADFPHPFVQKERNNAVQSKIVIPDEASATTLLAALDIGNYLNAAIDSEEKVPIVKEADLDNISNHIITVGLSDEWNGKVKELMDTIDLEDKQFQVDNHFIQSKKTIEENKTSNARQWMYVTAKDEESLAQNVALLTEEDYVDQLAGNKIAVNDLPKVEFKKARSTWTFDRLDIQSQTLNGKNRMSQTYFFQVPTDVDIAAELKLELVLKLSDTLFMNEDQLRHDEAELVVFINDVPHSIAIDDLKDTDENGLYHVDVPIDPEILQLERFVTVQFVGNGLRERDICVLPTDERWIYIDDSSQIQASIMDEKQVKGFQTWPSPFVSSNKMSETTIIVPDKLNEQDVTSLQLLMEAIDHGGVLQGMELVHVSDVDEDTLQDRDVIMIGDLSQFTSLEKLDGLELNIDEDSLIDLTSFGFVKETAKHLAYLQESVWNDEKMLAIFSPVQLDKKAASLSVSLVDYMNANHRNVQMIVENENGNIFTSDVQEEESTTKTFSDQVMEPWMIVAFVTIIIIAIAVFIIIVRNSRKQD